MVYIMALLKSYLKSFFSLSLLKIPFIAPLLVRPAFVAGGVARGGFIGGDFDRPTTQVNVNNIGRRGGVIAGARGGFIAGGGGFGPRPLLRGGFRRLQKTDIEGDEFDDEQFDDEQFENGRFDDEQMDRVEA